MREDFAIGHDGGVHGAFAGSIDEDVFGFDGVLRLAGDAFFDFNNAAVLEHDGMTEGKLTAFSSEFYQTFAHIVFAVNWREVTRADIVDHAFEFVLAAVTGSVNIFDLVVNHFGAEHCEFVDDGVDRFFVTWNW